MVRGCRDNSSCGEKEEQLLQRELCFPQVEISALSTELQSQQMKLNLKLDIMLMVHKEIMKMKVKVSPWN